MFGFWRILCLNLPICVWYKIPKHPKTTMIRVFIVLVATKIDLREEEGTSTFYDKGASSIQTKEVMMLAEEIGAHYVECSSLTNENVEKVFDEAISAWLEQNRKSKQKSIFHKFCSACSNGKCCN